MKRKIEFAAIVAALLWAGYGQGQGMMAPVYGGQYGAPPAGYAPAPYPGYSPGMVAPVSYLQGCDSCAGGCTDGCTDSGCTDMGCTDLGDACGCGDVCNGGCGGSGLFGGGDGCRPGLFGNGGLLAGGLFGGAGTCRPSRTWFDAEYLLWWNKERDLPPLVTSSPINTLQQDAGVIGAPGTSILFGNAPIGSDSDSGYRFNGGLWITQDQTFGVGGRYFQLQDEEVNFSATSTGDPILARPFFDTQTGAENALLVAFPNLYAGGINVNTSNSVSGGDLYLRVLLLTSYGNRLDLIGGYQYSAIDDSLGISHNVSFNDPNGRFPIGTTLVSNDLFDVENVFHGGTVGLMSESEDGCVTWRAMAKVGFGNMREQVSIRGNSTATAPNGAVAVNGSEGLYALPTNIGDYERNQFAVMPEVGVGAGLKITKQLQFTVGYSLLYWSRVQMAGDAVDQTVNTSQFAGGVIGPARPTFAFDDSSFWVQGINFGLNLRY